MITETLKTQDKPVVSLSGGVPTRNSFVVFDTATTEQLINALSRVREMEGATQWWFGDIGLALQERKQRELERKAKELRDKAAELDGSVPEQAKVKNDFLDQAEELENGAEIKYTAELCDALDIDAGYLKNCVSLARFYPPSQRCDGLKPHHHRVAMIAAQRDEKKAKEWLEMAKAEDWEASELRKHCAEAKAVHLPPAEPPEPDEFEHLKRADLWALKFKEKAGKLTPQQAVAVLSNMTELRALAFQLESIAKALP